MVAAAEEWSGEGNEGRGEATGEERVKERGNGRSACERERRDIVRE